MTPIFELSSKLFLSGNVRGCENLRNHALCSGPILPFGDTPDGRKIEKTHGIRKQTEKGRGRLSGYVSQRNPLNGSPNNSSIRLLVQLFAGPIQSCCIGKYVCQWFNPLMDQSSLDKTDSTFTSMAMSSLALANSLCLSSRAAWPLMLSSS